LVKSEVSDGGEGWNDSKIAEALDTSVSTVERTRRQIVGPVPQVQSEIGSVRISMAQRRLGPLQRATPNGLRLLEQKLWNCRALKKHPPAVFQNNNG
jgi:hypothetical protein